MTLPGRIKPNTMVFTKAERVIVKLKALVIGPSGGGKTIGALLMAQGIAGDNFALVDSENDRALYYADAMHFQHLSLQPYGFSPKSYMDAIDAAVAGGFDALVLDSMSHAWEEVLNRKDKYDAANPSSNRFANWAHFTKEWNAFVRHILDAPIHIIATARSKQSYEMTETERGSKRVEKMGLQPIIREGTEYEFATIFDILPSHAARCTKDNTGMFGTDDKVLWNLTDGTVPRMLSEWMKGARKVAAPAPYTGPRFPKLKGLEDHADKPLKDVPQAPLEDAYRRAKAANNARGNEVAEMLEFELERRRNDNTGDFESAPATPATTTPAAASAPASSDAPPPPSEMPREPGEESDPTIFGKAANGSANDVPGGPELATGEDRQQVRALAAGLENHWILGIEAHMARPTFSLEEARALFDVLSDPGELDQHKLRTLLGTNAPPQSRKLQPKAGAVADALKPDPEKAGVLKE